MCTQHVYKNSIKQEFQENLIALEKVIEEANLVLSKKYNKLKKVKSNGQNNITKNRASSS